MSNALMGENMMSDPAMRVASNAENIASRALSVVQDAKAESLATSSAVSHAYRELSKEVATLRSELATVKADVVTTRDECRKEAGYNRLAFEDIGRTVKVIETALKDTNPAKVNNAMAEWMSTEALIKRKNADQRERLFRLIWPVLVALTVWAAATINAC